MNRCAAQQQAARASRRRARRRATWLAPAPMAASADAARPLGSVEPDVPLRSGSRRRAVLVAHGPSCDLYILGADGHVRAFNLKSGTPLQPRRRLSPQLLDARFVRSDGAEIGRAHV